VQYQPRPLPPISELLRAVDENWPAPPSLFSLSHLEETIAAEGADDVFLGLPGSTFTEWIEDARMPSLLSYDAFRSPFVPNLPIQAEDATSSSFPLFDFSSWSGSAHALKFRGRYYSVAATAVVASTRRILNDGTVVPRSDALQRVGFRLGAARAREGRSGAV